MHVHVQKNKGIEPPTPRGQNLISLFSNFFCQIREQFLLAKLLGIQFLQFRLASLSSLATKEGRRCRRLIFCYLKIQWNALF